MKEFKPKEIISAALLSASLAFSPDNNPSFAKTEEGIQPYNSNNAGLVIPEEGTTTVERQQISNPFVLKQAEIRINEESFFLTRPDGVIEELSENEVLELSQNQMYLLLLAEQASLAQDVSQTYTLNNPQFFHNLYFYKEGNSLFVAGVTTFEEENGNRGIVFKDITDFAMPFYIQDEDNFSVARLSDGRFIPYYTNNNDPGRYTLTVGESLEPTSASLMEIPEGTDIENLEPIVFPQSITPIEGRVNIRQRPTTESQILAVMDYTQQLPVLGVVKPNSETEPWYVVPLISQNGEMVSAFVFSGVTTSQEQTAQGYLQMTPVPQDQLARFHSEILDDASNETAAIYEIASFTEPQMRSSDGRYTLYFSRDYLREEAEADNLFFDQRAVDTATNLIFEKSFGELNRILTSQGKPHVNQTDIVTLRPFVQRGSTIEDTNSIKGVISKIRHYVVTFEEMDKLREAIQENPNSPLSIDLYRSSRYKSGFAYFDQVDGSLVVITHPARVRSEIRSAYLSWNPIQDGIVHVTVVLYYSLIYGEAGSRGIFKKKTNADDIYNVFGCYYPNWVCNPELVSIK